MIHSRIIAASGVNDRGIFGGGATTVASNLIGYITISTLGNAVTFGNLSTARAYLASNSNGINNRGVFGGGDNNGSTEYNIIDYINILITSNASDFGDLTVTRTNVCGTSNLTNNRGVFGGGWTSASLRTDTIDYITISSINNAIDFGNLSTSMESLTATSNGINNRGVFGGGYSTSFLNDIDYITISTTGNTSIFGNLTAAKDFPAATSNGINNRGVFGGGNTGTSRVNNIDYITISTTSNASDFGDLTIGKNGMASTSNGINNRGVFGGGRDNDSVYQNTIEYITISTIGNASDFADLFTTGRSYAAALSNC